MKIKGFELNLFVKEAWPDDNYYWDHDAFDDIAEPDAEYYIEDFGSLIWQGNADEDPTNGQGLDLEKLIKKWRKTRTHNFYTISIPKTNDENFKTQLKLLKGIIL